MAYTICAFFFTEAWQSFIVGLNFGTQIEKKIYSDGKTNACRNDPQKLEYGDLYFSNPCGQWKLQC